LEVVRIFLLSFYFSSSLLPWPIPLGTDQGTPHFQNSEPVISIFISPNSRPKL